MSGGVLFLFVDGIGLAPASAGNPLSTLPTPALSALLDGPLASESIQASERLLLTPLDASLGLPGRPQSATGQTALFTGQNGALLLGHHVTAYPGPRLRELIAEHSLFKRARERGLRATFANPYTPDYLERVGRGEARASVTTRAVAAGDQRFRDLGDLERGEAVTWDIVGDHFAARAGVAVAAVTPGEAGRRLARLVAAHDLVVWETFLTDLAAHGRFGLRVQEAIARLDGLIGGCLAALEPGSTLLLTSDHGNLEDDTQPLHTTNPVPLLVVGPLAPAFARLRSILEVTPAILAALESRPPLPT